jgi:hypothetical protein
MADFPSRQDLFRVARDELLRLNGQITRETVERDGSDANILANLGVAVGDEVIGQLIDLCAGAFLDSSRGEKLDRLVFDRYSIVRKAASPSQGTVTFFTIVPNPAGFTIPIGTTVSTPDGIQFLTTVTTSFPPASTGPVFVPVRSVLAGSDQQATIGSITSIVSTLAGQPADLAVTNTVATAGADDAEQDDALRDRARRFFVTAQRGTIGALEAAGLAFPGVNNASAIEVLDALGRPSRFVQLVISDRFTDALANLGVGNPTYDTQSQQLATQVFLSLNEFRAAGVFVQVIVGQIILQSVQLQLTFAAGIDADVAALQARAGMVNYINTLSPGQSFVPATAITEALSSITGLIITGDEILTPAGTVVPKATQILRTSLSLVTAVAVQTSQPIALTTNPDAYIAGAPVIF